MFSAVGRRFSRPAPFFIASSCSIRIEPQIHADNKTRAHVELEKVSVAVVVQKMVESEISGIAFSVHPVTEDRNQLIIEAGFGLGEAIVSGQITPDSYVVEKSPRRIIDKNVSEQERGLFRANFTTQRKHPYKLENIGMLKMEESGSRNSFAYISKEKGAAQKLSDDQIFSLAELILKIENHYGFPCDIEWAFASGKFYITQSRPITTLKNILGGSAKSAVEGEVWIENFSADCGYNLVSQFLNFGMWQFQKTLFGKDNPTEKSSRVL